MIVRELVTLLRYQLQKSGVREYQEAGTQAAKAIQAEADKASRALRRIGSAFLAAFSAKRFINVTDEWQELEDRIDLAVDEGENAADVLQQIFEIAQKTRNPVKDVSEAFLENAQAIRDLGGSTQEALDFTTSLNAALDASGQRGVRAASITNALARAMRRGELRGVELNTVIAAGGNVAENLADYLGTTVSGLQELGAAGKITADDIRRALLDNMERNVADATSGVFSFRDGWVFVNNAIDRWIANAGKATGTSYKLGQALKWAGENIELLITAAAGIAAAFGIAKIITGLQAVGGAVGAIKAAWTGVAGVGAVVFGKFALIAAAALFVVLAAEDVYKWLTDGDSVLGRLVGSSEEWKEQLDAVVRPAKRVWDRLTQIAEKIGEAVTGIGNFGRDVFGLEGRFENVGGVIRSAFGGALRMVSLLLHGIDAALAGIIWAIEVVFRGITKVANAMPELAVETPMLGGRRSALGNPILQAMGPFGMVAGASVSVVQYITGTRDPEATADEVERRFEGAVGSGLPSAEASP